MKLYLTSKYTEFYHEPRAILNHNQTFFQWLILDFFFPLWISIIPTCDQNYISGFLQLSDLCKIVLCIIFQSKWLQSKIEFWPLHPSLLLLSPGVFHYYFSLMGVHSQTFSLFPTYLSTSVFALSLIPIGTLVNVCVCHINFLSTQRAQVHIHRIPLILSLIIPLTQALQFL